MDLHDVPSLLGKWPDRRAVWEDACALEPKLELVAVHRWFQRGSVPPRFWAVLLAGAARRGICLSADEIVRAHGKARDAA